MFILIVIFMLSLYFYVKLYTKRRLPLSFMSFIYFFCNVLQGLLYCSGLYIICFHVKYPIFLDNLSTISRYRYLVFVIISFLILSIITFQKIFPSFSFLHFIPLKEEIRILLYSWNHIFNPIYCRFIDKLYFSGRYRILYILTHFILFYLLRIIAFILLLQFSFFHGDLRYIIYLSPLFFILWILSFIEYYFQTLFFGHCNYMHAVLHVNKPGAAKLTPYGLEEGYTDNDFTIIFDEWKKAATISSFLDLYKSFHYIFNICLFSCQLIIWIYLVYYFFLF